MANLLQNATNQILKYAVPVKKVTNKKWKKKTSSTFCNGFVSKV